VIHLKNSQNNDSIEKSQKIFIPENFTKKLFEKFTKIFHLKNSQKY